MTLSASEAALISSVPKSLFIGGLWCESASGARFGVEDPSTGLPFATVADATVADGLAALTAASAAQSSWAGTAPRVRGELLRAAFDLVIARAEDFARLITLEMGKPLVESRAEVAYAAEFLRWFSEEAVRIDGRWMTAPDGVTRLLTMRKPVGPALLVTPWNFPLAMGTRKLGPALAAGCTVVLKPAAQTPLATLALVDVFREVGVPPGVINVITTTTSGLVIEPLMRDARTRKLSFTGSTEVGRVLVEQSASQLLRVSMELGGNAPFIVFDDADVEAAVTGAIYAKMRNSGQACTATNRFLVHASVAADFTKQLAERMAEMSVGRGTEDGVLVGPLIDEAAVTKVSALVADAVQEGARVVCGATAVGERGYFYAPTVLTDVPPTAALMREEIFGPVAAIATFETEVEAVERANDSEYGLAANVYTSDLSRVVRLGELLDYGMIGVNTGVVSNPAAPFGGVKASGFGREGGFEGIGEYLETTYLNIAPGPPKLARPVHAGCAVATKGAVPRY